MIQRLLGAGLLTLLLIAPVHADLNDSEDWNSAAQLREVRSMILYEGRVVAGTPRGGLLLVDPVGGAVDRFNSGDGLSSDAVTDLAVDEEGNLWVATGGEGVSAAGLCRLDPALTVRAVAQDLASNEITSIAADGSFLYYGTRLDGAGRLSGGLPDAIYTTDSHGLAGDRVVHVAAFGGEAWFSTQGGMSRLADNVFVDAGAGLEMTVVRELLAGAAGVFAADREGIKRWNPSNESWELHGVGLADSVRAMAFDGGDLVALGWTDRAWSLPQGSSNWESRFLDVNQRNFYALAPSADGHVWYGGKQVDAERTLQGQRALVYEPDTERANVQLALLGEDVQNLEPDGEGGFWVSCLAPWNGLSHWRSDGSFVSYDYDQETTDFGWCVNRTKFGLALDRRGDLWVSNFRDCITRLTPSEDDDPRNAEYLEITLDNSALRLRRTREIAEDPQGRIWFLSDGEAGDEGLGIDILEDPTAPFDDASWRELSPSTSLIRAGWVRSVDFEPPGTAWISIDGEGVQRWDYDGVLGDGVMRDQQFLASTAWALLPDDEVSSSLEFKEPRQVAIGPNGLIYIATADKGVLEVQFRPFASDPADQVSYRRIFRGGQAGTNLLSSNTKGAVFDGEGMLWVISSAGLNRLDVLGEELQIDAWTTIQAYQTFQLQLSGYLADVLAPMAGADLQKLRYDPVSRQVAMGGTSGFTRVQSTTGTTLPVAGEGDPDFLLYPNPFPGRSGDADGVYVQALNREGPVAVSVLNTEGIPIVKNFCGQLSVDAGLRVWDGTTQSSSSFGGEGFKNSASGLYVVQVLWLKEGCESDPSGEFEPSASDVLAVSNQALAVER